MIESDLLTTVPSIRHGFNTRQDPPHPDGSLVWLPKQTHSVRWHEIAAEGELPPVLQVEADAVVTRRSGQVIGIRTADCTPILVSAADAGIIGAIHAGRKGTEGGITGLIVSWLINEQGVAAEEIKVALGPCIQSCCYPVDLIAANREQLLEAGVKEDHIDVVNHCTRCKAELFHSYRRDGEAAGRQISWIMLR